MFKYDEPRYKMSHEGAVALTTVHHLCNVGFVVATGRMWYSRRMVLVFVVGLLFGYTLMYIVLHSLYTRSNTRLSSVHYFVPSAPHSHDNMNHYIPILHDVHQWHDFSEDSHISMSTFSPCRVKRGDTKLMAVTV